MYSMQRLQKKVMDNCPKLKYVVRYGVGVDTIDVPEATKHGIQVGNVPDYGMNEVADHAIALAMVMVREVVKMNQFTKNEKWDYTKSNSNPQIQRTDGWSCRTWKNWA